MPLTVAPNVSVTVPAAVAAVVNVIDVEEPTEATVSLEGIPVPETLMPAAIPAVDENVTDVLDAVVVPEAEKPRVMDVLESQAVVSLLRVKVVPDSDDTVVLAGIPVPEIVSPV